MSDMPFKSGDTLLVEEDKSVASAAPPSQTAKPLNESLNTLWNAQLGQVVTKLEKQGLIHDRWHVFKSQLGLFSNQAGVGIVQYNFL